MTDFEKKLSLSLSDLKKVQRRVTALEETSQNSMSYLERAADNCWEYPNADDKYAELSEKRSIGHFAGCNAVRSIENRGYTIRGIVLDGKQNVFKALSSYKLQMCHFHMKEIIKRYLTQNPRLKAARALKELMKGLTTSSHGEFESEYIKWKEAWKETLDKRSTLKDGKTQFRHKRLRLAMHSIDWYMPYLFTFQNPDCSWMPNTNNKMEGTFSDFSMKEFSILTDHSPKFNSFTSDKLVHAAAIDTNLKEWIQWYCKVYYGERF